ncbi:hypothetical protein NQ318_011798 [Aromia moschata]|uniref:Acyltransferase n=1 Tax=Aromia moschata TaxID=1265417 RepID=A0AAV8Y5N5_9CUCU|nr:hypothetical protein NQ318_011798 [Aromia moschata]
MVDWTLSSLGVAGQETPERGGRRICWVRSWTWWRYVKEYFPLRLKKLPGVDLDSKRNYLFCGFPHGFLPSGGLNAFLSDHSEFGHLFPYHTPHMAVVKVQFNFLITRELFLSLGAIASTTKSIEYVLGRPGGGNVCGLMVGGAKEVYNSKPGTYRIILKNRRGFVRLALRTGAPMVPFFSFGETDLYDQVMAVLIGRGFFQRSFGIIPRDCPVTTVVGEPIDVPQTDEPTEEQIDKFHRKFVDKLTQLFEEQKFLYLEKPDDTELIIE